MQHDFLKYWNANRPPFHDMEWRERPLLTAAAERVVNRVMLLSESDASLAAITAPSGHGKTTLARHIYQSLAPDRHEAVLISVFRSEHAPGWLLPKLASYFQTHRRKAGGPIEDDLTLVSRGLEEVIRERRRLALIIDEAHKLRTAEAFEEIQSLISLQGSVGSCITILLVGNEDLSASLQQVPALRPRLSFKSHIGPMTEQECREYVRHRLKAAGMGANIFEDGALVRLHQFSGGIYSYVNVLAENALMEAYTQKKRVIDQSCVVDTGAPGGREPAHASEGERKKDEAIPIQSVKKTRAPEPDPNAASENKQSNIRLSSLFYKNKS